MSEFDVYIGTIFTAENKNYRIDRTIPVMGGDGYFTVVCALIDNDGNEYDSIELEPYEIFTLGCKAEKIVYPDGSVFIRE